MKISTSVLTLVLAPMLAWLLPLGCTPELDNGRYACDPMDPTTCPEGFACLPLGPDHFCYSSWGPVCGEKGLEAGEQCDGLDFGGGDATAFGCEAGDNLYCLEQVCRVYCTSCGNGRLEITPSGGGEQCDDGNLEDGDGCSSSCQLETCGNGVSDIGEECDYGHPDHLLDCSRACRWKVCGNGIIDFDDGEHCDDGNLLSGDGCASDCTVEFPSWTLWRSPLETARDFHAMAYDEARGRLVLFGGFIGDKPQNDTWEYDGERWTRIRTANAPAPRGIASMVYDPLSQRMLLYGGIVQGETVFGDLWAYDGTDWTELEQVGGPSERAGAALAWDTAMGRLVLFGGVTDQGMVVQQDTWTLDATGWSLLSTAESPVGRALARLENDPSRGCLLLFGGRMQTSQVLSDTWELCGDTWTELTSPQDPAPAARYGHSLTWHGGLGRIVLHAGYNAGLTLFEDTWLWDGVSWTMFQQEFRPQARAAHAAAWHSAEGRLILHGGKGAYSYADFWALDASGWLRLSPVFGPPERINASAVANRETGQILLFGGYGAEGYLGDTWQMDEDTWSRAPGDGASPSPPARYHAAMVYDEEAGQTVLFGGRTASGVAGDTWIHDHTGWREVQTATSPPARQGHAMTYDPLRQRVILFGGADLANHFFGDTWELDPSNATWEEIPGLPAPGARQLPTLVWDSEVAAAVLFGGNLPSEMLNDTWLYRGGQWEELVTERRPPARAQAVLAFDEFRRRVILFGGSYWMGIPGENPLGDTWELRWEAWELGWHELGTADSPAPRECAAGAFNPRWRSMVLLGGIPGAGEVWMHAYRGFTPLESCSNGVSDDGDALVDCDDPDCAWDFDCQGTQ
ncbi:MAG: kelch repeat-containing protein [Polyangia bacterium]|nr:kelch repeat-containing protein [Polyangia bacterium]